MTSGTSPRPGSNRLFLGRATQDDLSIFLTKPPHDGREGIIGPDRTPNIIPSPDTAEVRDADSTRLRPQQTQQSQIPGHLSSEDRSASWPAVSGGQHIPIFRKRVQAYLRRSSKLDRRRDRVLFLRKQVVYEREEYRNKLRFVEESQRKFFEHLDSMMRNENFVASRPRLNGIYGEARADYLLLEEQLRKTRRLEDQLNQLEYSMQEREKTLTATAAKLLAVLRKFDPSKRDAKDLHELGASLAASTDEPSTSEYVADSTDTEPSVTPSALADFYDKAGDVNVMKDRLLEVDTENRDMLTRRMMQEDQGSNMSYADPEFEQYQAERKAAERELDEAISAREHALAICLEQGIDPEAVKSGSPDLPEMVTTSTTAPERRIRNQRAKSRITEGAFEISPGLLITPEILGDKILDTTEQEESESKNKATDLVALWIDSIDETQTNPWLEQLNATEEASPRPQPAMRFSFPSRSAQMRAQYGMDGLIRTAPGPYTPRSYEPPREAPGASVRPPIRVAARSRSSESGLSILRKQNLPHDFVLRRLSEPHDRR